MKYLITLSLAALTLYVFIKRTYKYATVQDEVDQVGIGKWTNNPSEIPELQAGDIVEHSYTPENGIESRILRTEPPIDYENTQAYKDNEVWFSGMGRC